MPAKKKEKKVKESPFDVIEKRFGELEKSVADLTKTVDMQTDAIKHLHHVIDAVAKSKEPAPKNEEKDVDPVENQTGKLKNRIQIDQLKREIQYADGDSQDALLTIANILDK